MDIDPSVVIATMINFVIFILILKHFFWDKIQKVIQGRQVRGCCCNDQGA